MTTLTGPTDMSLRAVRDASASCVVYQPLMVTSWVERGRLSAQYCRTTMGPPLCVRTYVEIRQCDHLLGPQMYPKVRFFASRR